VPPSTAKSAAAAAISQEPVPATTHVGFILMPDYSMIAFANAVETLRMANYISRRPLYRWTVVAGSLSSISASNGLSLAPTGDMPALDDCDMLFVCGGVNVRTNTDETLLRTLRQLAGRGITIGALCTGSFALASAGLLDGYRCAIHWENLAAISEEFPKIKFCTEVFIVDGKRITCSGGTAPCT
jgi:transcriptional regulator GlxA family with amidase domain